MSGIGKRFGLVMAITVVFAVVAGIMWYVVVPDMYGVVQSSTGPHDAGDAAETPKDDMYYMMNEIDFKQTLTHRYVMHPPCATVLDSTSMMEVRTMTGFPTSCSFDHNGNGLGDGWEDQNNDGYADGFTDCTKPYVLEDGWYVRDLRRDCIYGAPLEGVQGVPP